MSSSAGSAVFFSFALLVICLLVVLLLRYYLPLRTTPAYVLVPVFLAIAFPVSIVLLVPIDLASSAGTDTDGTRGIWLPEKVVYKSWRMTYWLTFALTWVILPLLGEYCDSGYREPKDRLMYALRSNGRYQLVMLGTGGGGAIYFFLQNGWNFESFKALIMALAYAWGLVLAIYLMGHGLVAVPRSLWRYASVSGRLRRLQGHAPRVHDRLTEALDQLEQHEAQVLQLRQRKNGTPKEFQDWIEELAEKISLPESSGSAALARTPTVAVPAIITERYLADLTRKLKRARHAKTRFSDEWSRLVRKAVDTETIINSSASKRLEFRDSPFHTPHTMLSSRFNLLTPYSRYQVYKHLMPLCYHTLAVFAAIASVCIIWSEIVKSLEPKLSLVGLTVVHHPRSDRGQIGFAGQLIAASWLSYMCMCALFSLTEVKIWGNRALVRRGTYQESATWYGLQVAKLTVPLAYNFVTFVPPNIYKHTSFYSFLGRLIVLTPLGNGFETFFPMLILVPVAASAFGLYAKIKNICGFADLLDDDEDQHNPSGFGSWREGRALIEREIQGLAGNSLGLARRGDDQDTDTHMGYRDEPVGTSGSGARADRRTRARDVQEEGDAGFFADFADRVRNTFDTTEFSRPTWMGGSDEGGRASRSAGAERGGVFARLFSRDEGRLRLV
jgi:hypothetical protein